MENINVFIISSVIYLSEKPLSYSKTRSLFSAEDRALQTKKTIESIRERVPQAKIILLELGLKKTLPLNIDKLTDQYVYIGDKKFVRFVCDSRYKGLGEIVSLFYLYKFMNKANNYFKISGRYYLNDNFNINNWSEGDFSFKFRSPTSTSTVLYKVKGKSLNLWFFAMALTIPFCFINRSIENVLFRFIPRKKIVSLDVAGISGLDSVFGKLYED